MSTTTNTATELARSASLPDQQAAPLPPVTLTIDGQAVTVPAGTSIWEAARQVGIEIPALCHSPRLRPVGVCRMCVVDVGERVLAASCVRACQAGMNVQTNSPAVEKHRSMLTRLLLSDQPVPANEAARAKRSELAELGHRYGLLDTQNHPTFTFPPPLCRTTTPDTLPPISSPVAEGEQGEDERGVAGSAASLAAARGADLTRSPGENDRSPGNNGKSPAGVGGGDAERGATPPALSDHGGEDWGRGTAEGRWRPMDLSSPVIAVDHQACILCDRCIRACDEVQSNEVIGRTGKGYTAGIAFDLRSPMGSSTCVSCGECASVCPTHALVHKTITLPVLPREELTEVDSVCPYCGVGCAITYQVRDGMVVAAQGRESPVNHERLCVKGRYGWDYAQHPHRLTKPLIRRAECYPKGPLSQSVQAEMTSLDGAGSAATGESSAMGDASARSTSRKPGGVVDYAEVLPAFREATWDEALDLVAQKLLQIRQNHGSGALAGFGSAKCSNEEAYLFQKLVRAVFGTNNVDHCTRLCHASSVAALMECIGSGAVTNVFADVARAEVALVTGSSTSHNHPVAATFIKEAVKQGTQLIVVDVRRHELAHFATHFAQIHPGTDVAFYNGVMHVLITENLIDPQFIADRTEGFEGVRELVLRDYSPEQAAAICGVPADEIRAIARTIGHAGSMLIFWGMGISQHTTGTDNARCLISLCLMTGNVGKPGAGLHPLRGQNNVQGASDAGLIPMVYPDYQPVAKPENRSKFEQAWGVPLDPKPGLTVVEITHGALRGEIKGMYILGENPFLSDPNTNKVRKALANLEFLVVQDIFLTETAEFADVILPATSYLEKTGTFTNTDRRVQVGRQVISPPGEARADWQIICDIAGRMGYAMPYASPDEVFAEFASLSKSYSGLTHDNLGLTGKLWPCANPATDDGKQILFGDRFPTPSGRGKFVPCTYKPPFESPDPDYPYILNTGRVLEHWHTGTMTRRSQALNALEPAAFASMNPVDLAQLGIAHEQPIRVSSRRGTITLPVRRDESVEPGCIFIPFHFREAAANVLTVDALDPFGKIPEFKFCAVRIEPA